MVDKDRLCVSAVITVAVIVPPWEIKPLFKKKEKEKALFSHGDMFLPDPMREDCSRAVAGCEPALRAAVNESNWKLWELGEEQAVIRLGLISLGFWRAAKLNVIIHCLY